MSTTLVWMRRDLRLADQPALLAATRRGGAVVPVHVVDPRDDATWVPGAASRWWLHHSLSSLSADLSERGSRLVVRTGEPAGELLAAARHCGADRVHLGSPSSPAERQAERRVVRALRAEGLAVETFETRLLLAPNALHTSEGKPYRVFTPFWNALKEAYANPTPLPSPEHLVPPSRWPASVSVDSLRLLPSVDWAGGLRESWRPGETGASERLDAFAEGAAADYADGRDRPATDGTARLSPHLHFGEVSPRQVWHAVSERAADGRTRLGASDADAFLRQLAWREFAHQLLHHFPETTDAPLRPEFEAFPWRTDRRALRAWQAGRTGYPLVDAGMRQLWRVGWMHNRVRLVVASFLVKHLLIPWLDGARWFWDTLVDADLANNTLGWQWTAGCGADAAPYFRVFNPVRQGEKLDPDGHYVRTWVPELAALDARRIHAPWTASPLELEAAGIRLGETYPAPIVDHAEARERALDAWRSLRHDRA